MVYQKTIMFMLIINLSQGQGQQGGLLGSRGILVGNDSGTDKGEQSSKSNRNALVSEKTVDLSDEVAPRVHEC